MLQRVHFRLQRALDGEGRVRTIRVRAKTPQDRTGAKLERVFREIVAPGSRAVLDDFVDSAALLRLTGYYFVGMCAINAGVHVPGTGSIGRKSKNLKDENQR